jgi:hypothetical protein
MTCSALVIIGALNVKFLEIESHAIEFINVHVTVSGKCAPIHQNFTGDEFVLSRKFVADS